MPPQVASLVFVTFVLWLLARDIKRRPTVSSALWIPLTWLFIIGSKPISLWLGGPGSFDSEDGYLEGSPMDRLFFLSLLIAGLIVISRRGVNWNLIFRQNKWLWWYFAYIGISVLWSDFTFVAFKRWTKDVGNVVMALIILTEEDPVEAATALLVRAAHLFVPLSVLLIRYYPDIGRYYDAFSHQPVFGGVTRDKNILGMSLFVCGLSYLWVLFERKPAGDPREVKRHVLIHGFLMLMTVWLLVKGHSSTALACTLTGATILFGTRYPAIRRKVGSLGAYTIGLAALMLALHITLDLGRVLVALLGRDLTFTGRTEIWSAVLKEDINPLFGVGYYSFWLGDRVQRLSAGFYYHLNEAHNGFLETYINVGVIGLGLLIAAFLASAKRISAEVVAGSRFAALRLAFLVGVLMYNLTEAAFDRLNVLWVSCLLVMIEYPRRVTSPVLAEAAAATNPPEYAEGGHASLGTTAAESSIS
jgi:O-antigen ligase